MITFITSMGFEKFNEFNEYFQRDSATKFWLGNDIKSYKYNYSVEVEGGSYYVGYWHNTEKNNGGFRSLKLQYNPNKINKFDNALERLVYYCFSQRKTRLKSFDVAFDIPIAFGNFILDKGVKQNLNTYKGTYYIGERSNGVKIYDKQKESGLSDPLTRYEVRLTLDNVSLNTIKLISDYENDGLPTITFVDTLPLDPFDRVLILGLLQEPGVLNLFNRRRKEKYREYFKQFKQFKPTGKEIISCLQSYLNLFE